MADFDSKEFWQEEAEDLSRALAAVLRHYGIESARFENWNVYIAAGYGAAAIEVDENNRRVPRSPVWIDVFEQSLIYPENKDDRSRT